MTIGAPHQSHTTAFTLSSPPLMQSIGNIANDVKDKFPTDDANANDKANVNDANDCKNQEDQENDDDSDDSHP